MKPKGIENHYELRKKLKFKTRNNRTMCHGIETIFCKTAYLINRFISLKVYTFYVYVYTLIFIYLLIYLFTYLLIYLFIYLFEVYFMLTT